MPLGHAIKSKQPHAHLFTSFCWFSKLLSWSKSENPHVQLFGHFFMVCKPLGQLIAKNCKSAIFWHTLLNFLCRLNSQSKRKVNEHALMFWYRMRWFHFMTSVKNEKRYPYKRVFHFSSNTDYAGGIWKRSFISPVRLTVHTNPSPKRSFSKLYWNRTNLKTPALRFGVDGKQSFSKTMTLR